VIGGEAEGATTARGSGLAPPATTAAEVIRGGAGGTTVVLCGGLAPAVEVVPMEHN
jgi:hypothetical protein